MRRKNKKKKTATEASNVQVPDAGAENNGGGAFLVAHSCKQQILRPSIEDWLFCFQVFVG